jgi:hypothetical protein
MNAIGTPDVSATIARTSSPASAGSPSLTDRTAPTISQTSGPPITRARCPAVLRLSQG